MQNDYCRKTGKAYAPEYEAVTSSIQKLLAKSREKNIPVVYTQNWLTDTGGYWSEAFRRGETVVPVHCIENTWGANIIDELKPTENEYVIRKTHYNMFLGTLRQDAEQKMTRFKELHPTIDTFVVAGIDANVCVFFNSDSLYSLGYRVILPVDCIGGSATFRAEKADIGYDHSIWFLSRLNGAKLTRSELITLGG